MNLRILPQLDLDGVAPVDDERNPGSSPSLDSGLPFITVEPWQIDVGQRLAGVPGLPVVDQVLFDGGAEPGAWLLIGDGVIVARVAVGGTVEVCAAQDVEGCGNGNDRGLVTRAVSPSATDACDPYGIDRPRRLIAVSPL